jgi:hypothetical protein
MCEPVSGTMIAMSLIGAAASAKGQIDAANFQAQVARNNALLASRGAVDADVRGSMAAGRKVMQGSQTIGQAVAQAGASGVDVASGSVGDVIGTTRMMARMDAETLRYNADIEAMGWKQRESNFLAEGRLASMKGAYGAATSILGGASQAAGMYYTGMNDGLLPKLGA